MVTPQLLLVVRLQLVQRPRQLQLVPLQPVTLLQLDTPEEEQLPSILLTINNGELLQIVEYQCLLLDLHLDEGLEDSHALLGQAGGLVDGDVGELGVRGPVLV